MRWQWPANPQSVGRHVVARRSQSARPDSEPGDQVVGQQIEWFIAARRRGERVSVEEVVLQLPEAQREVARECLEMANLLLTLP